MMSLKAKQSRKLMLVPVEKLRTTINVLTRQIRHKTTLWKQIRIRSRLGMHVGCLISNVYEDQVTDYRNSQKRKFKASK